MLTKLQVNAVALCAIAAILLPSQASADCTDLSCFLELPDGSTDCTVVATGWDSARTCQATKGCPAISGAFDGSCFYLSSFVYPLSGCDGSSANPVPKCKQSDGIFNNIKITGACDSTTCDAFLTGVDFSQCGNTDKMLEYISCYRTCAKNDYTKAFYGGICDGLYTVQECDVASGSKLHGICYEGIDPCKEGEASDCNLAGAHGNSLHMLVLGVAGGLLMFGKVY